MEIGDNTELHGFAYGSWLIRRKTAKPRLCARARGWVRSGSHSIRKSLDASFSI
ncbi:hypothetical protein KCP75_10205 [Salmonella enterica subsp. enterica]|nr:hypothetical protein KCP75_10205 [Salmonella enterica subsp. enterica]